VIVNTPTQLSIVLKIPTLLYSASSLFLSLVGNIFQYVKTTLANSNAVGHEYFRLPTSIKVINIAKNLSLFHR